VNVEVDRLLSWRAVASAEAAEDDAKTKRRMRKIFCAIAREALLDIKFRRPSRIRFTNALRTTRSTFARSAKGWIGFSEDDAKIRMTRAAESYPCYPRNPWFSPRALNKKSKKSLKCLTRRNDFNYKRHFTLKFRPHRNH
jgi:hypothetical protein